MQSLVPYLQVKYHTDTQTGNSLNCVILCACVVSSFLQQQIHVQFFLLLFFFGGGGGGDQL